MRAPSYIFRNASGIARECTLTVRPTSDEKMNRFDTPSMFEAIAAATRELDAAIAVVPYLSTGVTDSARLRRLGVKAYGILPFPMLQADEERMHGNDERVPLASLHFGTRLIYGAISRIAR